MTADLSALRDLHMPAGSGSALPGEIALAIALGFAAALGLGLARVLRARQRTSLRRAASRELALAAGLEPEARLAAQARLLRRIVRSLAGEDAASARGPDWAGALDRTFATSFFSRGGGRAFVDGLYRRPGLTDQAAVDAELARLVSRIGA